MRLLHCSCSAGLSGGLGGERPKAVMVRTRYQGLGKGWGENQPARQPLGPGEGPSKTKSEVAVLQQLRGGRSRWGEFQQKLKLKPTL